MMHIRKLGEVAEVVMGQAPAGSSYNSDGVGLPLVAGAGDFGELYPKVKKYTKQPSKISQPGDIILGIRASIGEKVLSDKEYCLGRGVAGVRAADSIDSQYLWHWLEYVAPVLKSKGRGATFLQVNKNDICSLEIPLLRLEEQKRIAKILDAADALRVKRRESLAQLDALLQSTFLHLFGDPVTNPKRWPLCFLSELGNLDRGVSKHRPRNAPELLGGGYPLIQTGDVSNSGGYIRKYSSTYSEQGLRQSKLWRSGTLCITIAANIANTGILTFDACFPDSVVGFTSDVYGRSEFVQGLFWFLRKILDQQATQVAQKNINLKILRDLEVPNPPDDLKARFGRIVSKIEEQKSMHQSYLAQLEELFKAMQQRAFSGEL